MDTYKSTAKALIVVIGLGLILILAVRLGMNIEAGMKEAGKSLSSWVQAVGSIAAIGGAVWIASDQHRREVERRDIDRKRASYLLSAELAWVGRDTVNFINQFAVLEPRSFHSVSVSDDEISDLLGRMAWCRQRADHKGQLAMIGALRHSLVSTARLIQTHRSDGRILLTDDRKKKIDEFRTEALGAWNSAMDIDTEKQYMA